MKKILFLLLIFPNIVLSQKETTVKEFYDNGQLKRETTYIDGLENGVELAYYENGQLSTKVHWLKGKWEGYFYSYYKDGSLQAKSYYKNGEKDGESIWYYSNGQIHWQCKYKNGKKHGYYKDFQDDGSIFNEQNYYYGEPHGVQKRYYGKDEKGNYNGVLTQVSNYSYGKKTGKWYYYSDKGKLEKIETYDKEKDGYNKGDPYLTEDYKDGLLFSKYDWTNHTIDGSYKSFYFYKNGNPMVEALQGGDYTKGYEKRYYENGNLESESIEGGKNVYYYPNGKVERVGQNLKGYVNYLEGKVLYYDKNGVLEKTLWFKKGNQLPEVEQTKLNEDSLRTYYSKSKLSDIEGIYKSIGKPNYRIGVIKKENIFIGIVLDCDSTEYWGKGEVKFILEASAINNLYATKYYSSDKESIEAFATLEKGALLEIKPTNQNTGAIKFLKLYPSQQDTISKEINKKEWVGNGTGFFISKLGYIATNYHVVKNCKNIEIEYINDNKTYSYSAKIIQSDPTNDLAILKIDDSLYTIQKTIPYGLKTRSSDVGTSVFTLGYPYALSGMGKEIKFTDGKISSKTGLDGDIRMYQTTAPIQGGNSGGPLFDYDGNLIGINSSKLASKDVDNVSYAIKASYLNNLMDVLPETISVPYNNSLSNKPLTEKIKILSSYVVIVKVK